MAEGEQGSARGAESPSLSGMLATLVPTALVAGIYILIFLILRMSQRRYYAPRTYLGSLPEHERTPSLPNGMFNWIGAFWKIPDVHALKHQSLDAYLFLRFLRICTTICFVGLCITWPVLFPVNITGGGSQEQLNVLSMSNIDTENETARYRYFAHAGVAVIYYGFVLYLILRECIFYINLRQAFLLAPSSARRISSRTVLFMCVPDTYLDENKLRTIFSDSAKRIWVSGDTTKLEELVEERDKVAMRLEKAEVKLLVLANAARLKAIKNGAPAEKTPPARDAESGDLAAQWIPKSKRPTHRLGPLGLLGKKVDTIEWCRAELQRLLPLVEAEQATYRRGDYKKIPAVFIEFYTQSDASAASQVLVHHQALHMTPKLQGVRPEEVIWTSLRLPWWQRVVRRYAVIAIITAMVLLWTVPVAVVGAISQIDALRERYDWLSFLDKVPKVIMGVITGLLPSVALAILMALVPIIIRALAKISGEPSQSRCELFTQNAYFAFQVIQVFLITTIASSGASVLGNLEVYSELAKSPTGIFTIVSSSLPKSSNFYISFFIVQGLTIAAGVLSQVVGFIIFHIVYRFFAKTPRALYQKWTALSAISWGNVLPIYTNIAVISISFSVIAPLMLFWSTLAMTLFYLAYRYNILFITDTKVDTRGLIYPRAIKQLFTGVYLAEICMVGMTVVSRAIGPAVILIVFLVFTILFHITIQSALDPLLYNLPRTLQVEEELLMTNPTGSGDVDGEQVRNGEDSKVAAVDGMPGGKDTAVKKGNFFMKFLKPWQYASYHHLRKLVPHGHLDLDHLYEEVTEANAYFPPAVTSPTPLLWIPEDPAGISKQEVAATSKVIPITDEGCTLDDKNKIVWDTEGARPPIWDEKIYY